VLDGEEGRELDIARVQLDLDNRAFQHLIPDETEIFDSEGDTIVVRVWITQRLEEFGRIGQHPLGI